MKILFISTVNGKLDEGMRNVATHIGKGLEKRHSVRYIQLRDFWGLLKNLFWCDQVLICARADKKMYLLLRLITHFRKTSAILVQRPTEEYLNLTEKHPLKIQYFTISSKDAACIPHVKDDQIVKIAVGIDNVKFSPVDKDQQAAIKKKLGICPDKPLILHVGHCSTGRKVERICEFDPKKYERLVITSGMFEDNAVRNELNSHNVKVISGYLPDIEQYYQAADAYFFPTESGDYVISIPLSVMEALSAGTAVVAYSGLAGLTEIDVTDGAALQMVMDDSALESAAIKAIAKKSNRSYLKHSYRWPEIAERISIRMESDQ